MVADASTAGNTGSATIISNNYTKIGRQVTVSVQLTNIVTTGMTATNVFYVRGFPFISSTTNYSVGSVKTDTVVFEASRTQIISILGPNDSWMSFQVLGDGIGEANVDVDALTSGTSDIAFTITYNV